jgi:UDP-glucose 4-epimerase
MAYLITGGTGLIGSRIVRDLIRDGESVVSYDYLPEVAFLNELLTPEEQARIKIVIGDVTDLPLLLRTVKENKVDTIIHMASLLADPSKANPPLAIKINCEGTNNVFEVARHFGLKKVVWASSTTVFGPPDKHPQEYISNDAPHYPYGVYGACKAFNENIAANYTDLYGLDISGIRYTTVYGPGQRRGAFSYIMRELVENPILGKPGRVPFGDDVIGWLYVDDAARATVLLSRASKTRTRNFTLSAELHSIMEAADYVRQLLPTSDITLLPGRIGVSSKFDTKPIEEEVGYRPEWPMERGLREVINTYCRQHGLPTL